MNVKEIVIEKITEQMERGVIPWRQPWFMVGKCNPVTGIVYSGINRFMLADSAAPLWITFKQAKERGAQVRKGEHGHMVVFWKIYTKKGINAATGEPEEIKTFVLKYYTVFSLDQIEGLDPAQVERWEKKMDMDRGKDNQERPDIESMITANDPEIRHADGTSCFYSPALDYINMPEMKQFDSSGEYYKCLSHEMAHWTGHKSRLDRINNLAAFGREPYAKEELIAEIASSMVCQQYGIDYAEQSAAYIDGWMKAIKDNQNIIFSSATQAEKAFNFLMGNKEEAEKDAKEEE